MLYGCMTCVGIAWASILSMPYAMLSGSLPKDKVGIYMGIFNFFIVLPEIIASLGFGWLMKNVLHNDRLLGSRNRRRNDDFRSIGLLYFYQRKKISN